MSPAGGCDVPPVPVTTRVNALETKPSSPVASRTGIDRYFDWSFYSQWTRDQSAVSADIFIAEALAFFGVPVRREPSRLPYLSLTGVASRGLEETRAEWDPAKAANETDPELRKSCAINMLR